MPILRRRVNRALGKLAFYKSINRSDKIGISNTASLVESRPNSAKTVNLFNKAIHSEADSSGRVNSARRELEQAMKKRQKPVVGFVRTVATLKKNLKSPVRTQDRILKAESLGFLGAKKK